MRVRPRAPLQNRWLLAAATLGLLAALLVGLKLGWFTRLRPQPQAEVTQRQITANAAEDPVVRASLSPDGKYLAYTDLAGLHLRLIATGETYSLPVPLVSM